VRHFRSACAPLRSNNKPKNFLPRQAETERNTETTQETQKELRLMVGMTTGSRKQSYNGFADSRGEWRISRAVMKKPVNFGLAPSLGKGRRFKSGRPITKLADFCKNSFLKVYAHVLD